MDLAMYAGSFCIAQLLRCEEIYRCRLKVLKRAWYEYRSVG